MERSLVTLEKNEPFKTLIIGADSYVDRFNGMPEATATFEKDGIEIVPDAVLGGTTLRACEFLVDDSDIVIGNDGVGYCKKVDLYNA